MYYIKIKVIFQMNMANKSKESLQKFHANIEFNIICIIINLVL